MPSHYCFFPVPIYPQGVDEEWVMAVGGAYQTSYYTLNNYGDHMDFLAPHSNQSLEAYISGGSYVYDVSTAEQTSAATAHASGIAALLLSYRKDLENAGNVSIPPYLAPEDIVLLMGEETKWRQIPGSTGYPHQKHVLYGYGIINAEETLKRLYPPFALEHLIIPYSVNTLPTLTQFTVPIGFPGDPNPTQNDVLHDVKQYHISVEVDYPGGRTFPQYHRVWGRGMKTKGFPPIREILVNGVAQSVTLFRGIGWCKVKWFNDTRCRVETYLYEVTPAGTNNWHWFGGVTPNDVVFAISVLHEGGTVSVSALEDAGFEFLPPHPQPLSIKRNGALNLELTKIASNPLSLHLFDALGREVPLTHNDFPAGINRVAMPLRNSISPGVYFVRGTSGSNIKHQKIVVAP